MGSKICYMKTGKKGCKRGHWGLSKGKGTGGVQEWRTTWRKHQKDAMFRRECSRGGSRGEPRNRLSFLGCILPGGGIVLRRLNRGRSDEI